MSTKTAAAPESVIQQLVSVNTVLTIFVYLAVALAAIALTLLSIRAYNNWRRTDALRKPSAFLFLVGFALYVITFGLTTGFYIYKDVNSALGLTLFGGILFTPLWIIAMKRTTRLLVRGFLAALPITLAYASPQVGGPVLALSLFGTELYYRYKEYRASLQSNQKTKSVSNRQTLDQNNPNEATPMTAADLYPARTPRFTFEDVHGMAELKAQLAETYENIRAGKGNGIFFMGDPGNGKTFIAEAFAGQANIRFLEARVGEMASRWVNQTTEQMRMMFDAARLQAPCVIFLDEIDSVARDRNHTLSGGDMEAPRITNNLMTLLADMASHPEYGVIVVAASNYPDMIDQAAFREGRFSYKITVPAPDQVARVALLKHRLKKGLRFEPGVPERAARRWEGFSVARIQAVADRVADVADRRSVQTIDFRMLSAALREVQGSLGGKLPENTLSLEQLRFDTELGEELRLLARRMMNVEEIEKMGGTLPKGVLFAGPPGTGKTAVAKGLAKTTGWAFLSTTGQALLNSESDFSALIKKANDLRPCIVFVDEADDILMDRANNPYGKASTNKLLALMDGTIPLHDVTFIAATNFAHTLDSAAVRGGRFSEIFTFELPSKAIVASLIQDFMKAKPTAPWSQSFDANQAATLLHGLAPSDINDRLQKTLNRVAGRGHGEITIDELNAVLA